MSSNIQTGKTYIDQGWAWVILIASTAIMILIQGNIRSFGIFVAELQREFHSSAAVVSSILSTQAIANSICAFIVLNCLSKAFPLRVLVIMGCLFSTICFILDWQATRIELVTIFHVLNGMGSAFTYGPSMVILGHYFVKYRGTAYALTSCGASVGQFALSPLFSYLITEYGIKGALLLNASVFLQCVTFAMLLRPTSFFHDAPIKNSRPEEESSFIGAIADTGRSCLVDTGKGNERFQVENESLQVRRMANDNDIAEEKQLETLMADNDIKQNQARMINHLQDEENSQSNVDHEKIANVGNSQDLSHDSYTTKKHGRKHGGCFGKSILSELKSLFTNVDFKLFNNPIFLTYFFGCSIGILASYSPQAFFPSHAEDMGLDQEEGMLFVAIAGFADLGGRILTTLIADQKWLNRPRFLGCVLIVHGIVACFIPFFDNFLTFAAYCVLYGVSGGIIFAISNTILTDYIGVEKLPQGLGLMLFFNGFASAGAFLFIGFFRGFIGSYNPGFVVNGISLVVSGAFFCAEACIKYEKQPRR